MIDLYENAEKAIRMVKESKELVYDTETSGLDWRVHSAVGYVVGAPAATGRIDASDVVYIPVRHGGGGNLLGGAPMATPTDKTKVHPFEIELAKAFEQRNSTVGMGRVVGHHTKFDVHMSANHGIRLGRRLACTQNMAALVDEYAKRYSLEAVAERMGVTPKKGDALYEHMALQFGGRPTRDIMQHFWRTSGTDPLPYEYSVGDGVTTMETYWGLEKEVEEQELRLVTDMENDLIWTLFRMERRGIKIDMEEADKLRLATENNISTLMQKFPVGFNTRSPAQMRELMEQNGHTNWPHTEKGAPSFNEKWLKTNELGRTIIEIRKASNLINSFVNPLREKHSYLGRVHATLNQLKNDDKGTISGRFSCSDPNLQQVPKHNKALAKPFRRLFVSDGPEWVFWERDYSQCEPRLFAHYAQDPNLLAGYNAKPFVDAHTTVANLLNVERDPTAKRMNMGIFTGMQPRTFSEHMGWDLNRATKAWNQWFNEFPGVRDFQNKAKARLKTRGYVHTLLGRRGRLEHPRFAYVATSKIIQGSNADIVKWKLLAADRMCEDSGDIVQVNMTVHDSFNGQYLDTPEARKVFDDMIDMLSDVQCEPFNLSVPFVLEGTEGKNWAEATYGVE